MVRRAGLRSVACLVAAHFFSPITAHAKETLPHVQFIYLVPQNRQIKPAYQRAIELSALNIQQWIAKKLQGYTFDLDDPVVTIIQSGHEAAWYADNETKDTRRINRCE